MIVKSPILGASWVRKVDMESSLARVSKERWVNVERETYRIVKGWCLCGTRL